jgi:hypothetical protein
MVARRSCNDGRKTGMQRNDQLGASLLLFDIEGTITDVLRPHSDHVAPTLSGI